jgi:hypothetical protein
LRVWRFNLFLFFGLGNALAKIKRLSYFALMYAVYTHVWGSLVKRGASVSAVRF